jgi:hypothetical protein
VETKFLGRSRKPAVFGWRAFEFLDLSESTIILQRSDAEKKSIISPSHLPSKSAVLSFHFIVLMVTDMSISGGSPFRSVIPLLLLAQFGRFCFIDLTVFLRFFQFLFCARVLALLSALASLRAAGVMEE